MVLHTLTSSSLSTPLLPGEEILASNQRQIIEQAKFVYSPSGKGFEKQTKAVEE